MRKMVEVECAVCGKKIQKIVARINWEKKRNPEYKPTCSIACRDVHRLKKKETCAVFKLHRYAVQDDPERLTTEDIVNIMCETKPRLRSYHCSKRITHEKTEKPRCSPRHKGYLSSLEWSRLNNLVRAGKASFWSPLRTLDEAIAVAGI